MKPLPALSFFRAAAFAIAATFAAIAPASLAATDGFEAYRLQQQQGAQKIIAEFTSTRKSGSRILLISQEPVARIRNLPGHGPHQGAEAQAAP